MEMTSKNLRSVYEQSDAVGHYLSQSRRDGVKVQWEEPFSRAVFKQAVSAGNKPQGGALKVADIGSGTGDGYVLLSTLLAQEPNLCDRLEYLGVDISPAMVEAANKLYGNGDSVQFECADIRRCELDRPIDLYLSCGVPYSHLTQDELHKAIQLIVANVRKQRMRCAVIIDVLGKYSIEWTPQWGEGRWNYCMSFFETEKTQEETWMSFYSHDQLRDVMESAAKSQACPVEKFAFFDRSIMVGRHTSTRQFNPSLPPYRDLVNGLLDPSKTTDLSQLIFSAPEGDAPQYILDFFKAFSMAWNTLVYHAAQLLGESLSIEVAPLPPEVDGFKEATLEKIQAVKDESLIRPLVEKSLAQALCLLEQTQQPGYGVGHDLFGVMWLDARNV